MFILMLKVYFAIGLIMATLCALHDDNSFDGLSVGMQVAALAIITIISPIALVLSFIRWIFKR